MGLTSSSVENPKKSLNLSIIKTIQNAQVLVFIIQLLTDNRLAACCEHGIIHIFNLFTSESEMMIQETNQILIEMSSLSNNRLILASAQGKITIYKIYQKSYKLLSIIDTYTNSWIVKVIPLSQNRIGCITRNNKILFFNSEEPYNEIKTIETAQRLNSIYQLNDKEILLCFLNDDSLSFMNLETYDWIKTINHVPCYSRRSIVELSDGRIITGGENIITIIKNYQIETQIIDEIIDKVESLLVLNNKKVLIGSGNQKAGMFSCLDLDNCSIFYRKPNVHCFNVDSLILVTKGLFVSCSWDHKIHLWEYE